MALIKTKSDRRSSIERLRCDAPLFPFGYALTDYCTTFLALQNVPEHIIAGLPLGWFPDNALSTAGTGQQPIGITHEYGHKFLRIVSRRILSRPICGAYIRRCWAGRPRRGAKIETSPRLARCGKIVRVADTAKE